MYRDGPQTPKLYHDEFDIYVPLQFWFCRDASHALLNDLIPNSQRTITCELAPLTDIIQATTTAHHMASDPFTLEVSNIVDLPFSRMVIESDLYVNGLYVNPEIHDIFASRVGFNLIRVHRYQTNQLQSVRDSILLDQLKFPAEFLMVGFRSRKLVNDFDRWWLMGFLNQRTDANKLLIPAMIWNSELAICQLVCREAVEVTSLENSIETIGVTAHGIEIFPQMPSTFYNAYMPIRYSENSMVVSPVDMSAFLINFCLYPGSFNPSGYYNLSAGRELYINYSLKQKLAELPSLDAEMVISMSALNFLMRRGDSLSLRYSL